jgi:hypothetical protein
LIYSANARGLGTMYWENRDGLKNAAAVFAAPTMEKARELIERAGVTHVVLFSWDGFEDNYVRLARGLGSAASVPRDTFAVALREGRLPAWLRPLPHPLPPHPAFRGHEVRLFEVTEERAAADIAVHAAAFAMESGRAELALAMEPELERHAESLAATAALAGLQARRRDQLAFFQSVVRMENLLSQADVLPLEDSVRVALAFGIGLRKERAAGILKAALARADERALRRLTPGTLSDLFTLNDALGVTFTHAALQELAVELMPPK